MRKYIRHPSDAPLDIRLEDVVVNQREYLRDISHGGLCFTSKCELAPGVVLTIRIPLVKPIFEAQGRVVWCSEAMEGYLVGVEFLHRGDLFRARMVEQVCYIEHYRSEIRKTEGRDLTGEEAALEWIRKYAPDFPHLEQASPELPPEA